MEIQKLFFTIVNILIFFFIIYKMNNIILLICGYSKHGKDRLYEYIKRENNLKEYVLYGTLSENDLNLSLPINKLAFADELKIEVYNTYHTLQQKYSSIKEADLSKDVSIAEFNNKTFRDLLIDYATNKRSTQGDDYFAALVAKKIIPNTLNVITDFRYIIEYDYIYKNFSTNYKIITARVIRPHLLSQQGVRNENHLDSFKTDFIIISKEDVKNTDIKNLNSILEKYT